MKEKKFNFVFITTNLINGKQYVGDHSSDDLNCVKTKKYLGSGRPLFQNAIKKHGRKNFKREILEFFLTKKEAFDAQEKYIMQYNTLSPNGYNISPKGGNNVKGCHSEETIKKMRNSHIGLNHTEETKVKMRKPKSEEHKRKNRESHKGQIVSLETIEKIRKANTGKKHTEETKEKMRKAQQNRPPVSEETKAKMKGKKRSEKSKEKNRIAHTGKKQSQETKDKRRKSMLGKNKGKKMSKEVKEKNRKSHLGKPSPFKGKTLEEIHGVERAKEIKKLSSESLKGKTVSKESKEKNRKSHLGKTTWNKGLTKETDERVKNMSEKSKNNNKHKGQIPWNKGKKMSKFYKNKQNIQD